MDQEEFVSITDSLFRGTPGLLSGCRWEPRPRASEWKEPLGRLTWDWAGGEESPSRQSSALHFFFFKQSTSLPTGALGERFLRLLTVARVCCLVVVSLSQPWRWE